MKITIKHRISQEVILEGEYESIKDALEKNRSADLRSVNLSFADLSFANLCSADLRNTKGQISWLKAYTLSDYIAEYKMEIDGVYFFAFKGVTDKYKSPNQNNKLDYIPGTVVKVAECNPDVFTDCGHGINLCPSVELAKEWGSTVVKVKVHMADVACLPIERKKFRVKCCEVIEEVTE